MKLTQKRYIYSGIFSGIFFVIIYCIINLNLPISLILTVAIFMAGILIFKEKDVKEYDPTKVMDYYYQTSKLLNYSNYIDDAKIKELVKSISKSSESILKILEQKSRNVTQIYNFYDYYMDLALKIVNKYMQVKNENNEFVSKTDDYLKKIYEAFEKQLNSMAQNKTMDVDREIKIFEKIVKIDNHDIKGSDTDV